MEKLETIEDFPDYQISNLGYVLSTKNYKSGTIVRKLVPHKDKRGYEAVSLSNNGFQRYTYIHILVAEYFKDKDLMPCSPGIEKHRSIKEMKYRASYLKSLRGIIRLTYTDMQTLQESSLKRIEKAKQDVKNITKEMRLIRAEIRILTSN